MHKSESEFSESQIIQLLQQGDQTAISIIYDKYSGVLYGVCMKILNRNEGLAQDALQESVLKIWKYGKTYDSSKGRLFTWMLNITKNTAIDHWRKVSKVEKIQKDISDVHINNPQLSTSKNVDTIDVPANVDKLSNELREVIELAYFEGMTHQQISNRLDMPLGTVKTRIKNGIRILRKIYIRS